MAKLGVHEGEIYTIYNICIYTFVSWSSSCALMILYSMRSPDYLDECDLLIEGNVKGVLQAFQPSRFVQVCCPGGPGFVAFVPVKVISNILFIRDLILSFFLVRSSINRSLTWSELVN